jgi:hypothetical protein
MSKLRRLCTPESDRLEGYLSAAQHVFVRGELEIGLEAALLEITDSDVSDEEVILAAFPDGFNPIENSAERSVAEMVVGVHHTLRITEAYWTSGYSVCERVQNNLREGYWQHVQSCFDYTDARIVELGPSVPYVNMGDGFTYVLYASDMSRCLLLIGNVSD